jgi:hypothetical protein
MDYGGFIEEEAYREGLNKGLDHPSLAKRRTA